MRTWFEYAAAGLIVALAGGAAGSVLLDGEAAGAVWFSAGLAWTLQLIAFGALLAVRGRPQLFMPAWLSGLVLRFSALGAVALWLSRSGALPLAPALLSLVAFVFVLLMLEPVFLRRGLQTR